MVGKSTTAKQQINNRSRIFKVLAYLLVVLLFAVAYLYNEYLQKVNLERYDAPDYYYDYHLHSSEIFLFAMIITLILMRTMEWSVQKSHDRNKFKNRKPLVATAALLYLAILVCLFDISFGGWGIPGKCGSGFSIGNCFLAEGLGEMIYLLAIPILYVLGTILLIINKKTKERISI